MCPNTDKTNNKGLLLLQLVGVDGNFSTFTAAYALVMSSTERVFSWIFECCSETFGAPACAAVGWLLADADAAIHAALNKAIVCTVCLSIWQSFCFVLGLIDTPIRIVMDAEGHIWPQHGS
jgi:hypothetical protein